MTKRMEWKDLNTAQRVLAVVLAILQFGLLIAAQVDINRRRASEINGSKRMWRGIVMVNYVGPVAYFFLGVKR